MVNFPEELTIHLERGQNGMFYHMEVSYGGSTGPRFYEGRTFPELIRDVHAEISGEGRVITSPLPRYNLRFQVGLLREEEVGIIEYLIREANDAR